MLLCVLYAYIQAKSCTLKKKRFDPACDAKVWLKSALGAPRPIWCCWHNAEPQIFLGPISGKIPRFAATYWKPLRSAGLIRFLAWFCPRVSFMVIATCTSTVPQQAPDAAHSQVHRQIKSRLGCRCWHGKCAPVVFTPVSSIPKVPGRLLVEFCVQKNGFQNLKIWKCRYVTKKSLEIQIQIFKFCKPFWRVTFDED